MRKEKGVRTVPDGTPNEADSDERRPQREHGEPRGVYVANRDQTADLNLRDGAWCPATILYG